jgi:hypothetical protein
MARSTSVSACKDSGAEFPDLEEANIQVALDCLAAELPEEDLEQLTLLMG